MPPTNPHEMFDVYDAQGAPLGYAKPRGQVHRDGDWHRSAHVWVFTPDDKIVFQRRASSKDTWPGRLDASVGGHYGAGESGGHAVVREVAEELGLTIDAAMLTPIGVRRIESMEGAAIDREWQDVYVMELGLPLDAYRPAADEVAGLALLGARDAVRLHEGAIARALVVETTVGFSGVVERIITAADLIPNRGSYLAAVARAIAAIRAGALPIVDDIV